MEQKKSKTFLYITNIIILIIIVILLFLLFKKVSYNGLNPTGNIDIFNIECNTSNNCNCPGNDDNPSESSDDKLNSEENYPMDNLDVADNSKIWNSENELRIFSNPAYDFESVIAPGSSNSYQFVVNNNNKFDILYSLNLIETNDYSINMKYKLKRNGEYIFGDNDSWADAEDIKKEDLALGASSHDTYFLEWKWIDDDNDTESGFNEANYKLKIEINAKSA